MEPTFFCSDVTFSRLTSASLDMNTLDGHLLSSLDRRVENDPQVGTVDYANRRASAAFKACADVDWSWIRSSHRRWPAPKSQQKLAAGNRRPPRCRGRFCAPVGRQFFALLTGVRDGRRRWMDQILTVEAVLDRRSEHLIPSLVHFSYTLSFRPLHSFSYSIRWVHIRM